MFEIEQFIRKKIDLALNNPKSFIYHKPKLTNKQIISNINKLCHVIAHGDEEVGLILSSRIEWEYQAVKKWPLGENVGHGGQRPDVHT